MSQPSVAAVVLNYNGKELTLQTVASLKAMNYPSLEIVVVDNGSTDDSFTAVAEAHPDVVSLRQEVNQGIAVGLNLGISWVLERDYDYLLVLNNDIEVAPDMLTELVRVAESDPSIGCVGPKTYYYADRNRLWSAGGIIRFKESVTRERGMKHLDRGQYDVDREMPYINGCAQLVPRRAMAATGLWDPVYYVGIEDADWCMRLRRAGFKCAYAHKALLWHMVSPTTGGYKPGRTFQTGRGSAIFVRKYAGWWQWITFWAHLAAAIPAAYLRELPRGNQAAAVAKLKGVLAGLRVPLTPPPPVPKSGGEIPTEEA